MLTDLIKLKKKSARLVRNASMDLRYGAFLGGSRDTNHSHLGASWTTNTDYALMPMIFDGRIKESDVLVDIGCGKGRVINWWLSRGYKNKMVGIDLEEELAAKIRHRLRKYTNVSILTGNALDLLPPDGTVYYLYSPFTANVMSEFRERLASMHDKQGNVTILYYAPYHLATFKEDPRWEIEEIELDMSSLVGNHLEQHYYLAVIRLKSG